MLKNQLKIKVITLTTLVLLLVVSSIFLIKSTNALEYDSNKDEIINSINTTDTTYTFTNDYDNGTAWIIYTDDTTELVFDLNSWDIEYSYNFAGENEELIVRIESIIIKGFIQVIDTHWNENIAYEYEVQLVQPYTDEYDIYQNDIVWYTGVLKEDLLNENVIHSTALENVIYTEASF